MLIEFFTLTIISNLLLNGESMIICEIFFIIIPLCLSIVKSLIVILIHLLIYFKIY